jgi:metal-sulfur cluster biosynthetic enzyme
MSIELTHRAAAEIGQAMAGEGQNPSTTALRVDVRLTRSAHAAPAHVLELTETWSEDADFVGESQGVRVVCRKESFGRLKGTTIDFRDQVGGSGFVFNRSSRARHVGEVQDQPAPDEAQVRSALRHVIDPEIGMNIVDLGLVYGIDLIDRQVELTLTMTTPACPLSEQIKQDARQSVLAHCPGAMRVDIELVWDPPWGPHLMSADARQLLGWAKA